MSGPSTNFYVGRDATYYTIPKRLLYKSSNFTKLCLESSFAEAGTNAVWLPDVSLGVFQWVWKWLYQGRLEIEKEFYWFVMFEENGRPFYSATEPLQQACQLLCRVHMLGERLLMETRFLRTVQEELEKVVKRGKDNGYVNPFTPELLQEVLSQSTPVVDLCAYSNDSLRSSVFEQLRDYEFCANFDFMKCSECFEFDGAFAGKLMDYMSRQLVWAVELWSTQTESTVNVVENSRNKKATSKLW